MCGHCYRERKERGRPVVVVAVVGTEELLVMEQKCGCWHLGVVMEEEVKGGKFYQRDDESSTLNVSQNN